MFGSGWAGSAQTPWEVHETEGKKWGLKEGERWPQARFMTDRRHCPGIINFYDIVEIQQKSETKIWPDLGKSQISSGAGFGAEICTNLP